MTSDRYGTVISALPSTAWGRAPAAAPGLSQTSCAEAPEATLLQSFDRIDQG
jgi:hypothetical protein